jgi:hypothetical protein
LKFTTNGQLTLSAGCLFDAPTIRQNGSPLTDPARGLSAITGLQPGDRVNVTVSRNGVTRDITIEANQLAKAANSAAPPPEPTE